MICNISFGVALKFYRVHILYTLIAKLMFMLWYTYLSILSITSMSTLNILSITCTHIHAHFYYIQYAYRGLYDRSTFARVTESDHATPQWNCLSRLTHAFYEFSGLSVGLIRCLWVYVVIAVAPLSDYYTMQYINYA